MPHSPEPVTAMAAGIGVCPLAEHVGEQVKFMLNVEVGTVQL